MENHLHLAEARGSLRAPNSEVQDLALRILRLEKEHQRTVAESRVRIDAVKTLLVQGHSLDRVEPLFPEFFPEGWKEQRAIEKARTETGQIDVDKIDDSDINWGVATPEDDDEISRWIAERETGSIKQDTLDNWR